MIKCGNCDSLKNICFGLTSEGREKRCYICEIQPLASDRKINPVTGEMYGFNIILSKHRKKGVPDWCPKRVFPED